jgi:hypothetical protein
VVNVCGCVGAAPVLSGRSGDRSSSEDVAEDPHTLDAFELPGTGFHRQYSDSSLLVPARDGGREVRSSGASDTHSPGLSPFFEPRSSSGVPVPPDRPLGPGRVPACMCALHHMCHVCSLIFTHMVGSFAHVCLLCMCSVFTTTAFLYVSDWFTLSGSN